MEDTAKKHFPGELALLAALVLNSFAVTMIIKSSFGLSVVSGVPYVLSLAFPALSMGIWNTTVQCAWMLVLMVVLRRFRPGYVLSFGLALLFGLLLDGWARVAAPLPDAFVWRLVYFAASYVAMACGIALLMRCGLPILPFDTVPREFVTVKGLSVKQARTGFDLINLVLMLALGLIFLGYPAGIGLGTVFNALLMGTGAGLVADVLDRFFIIEPRLQWLKRLT